MKIKQITTYLEELAPISLQESYDNCGLIIGSKDTELKGILISLDTTEEVVEEAIKLNCNLIISHHPIVFNGIKKINGNNYVERTVIKAIENKVAIYAIHTNLDNIFEGVNNKICRKLNLKNLKILLPKNQLLKKLVTFVPNDFVDKVRKSILEAGAGTIGNYDFCSFNIKGYGTFRALENANPFVGKTNEIHNEDEVRLETIFPSYLTTKIIKSLTESHPYEEVAFDIYPIENSISTIGSGMTGELEEEITEIEFLETLKTIFNLKIIKHTQFLNKKIKKISVCGGSGSFLLKNAINANSDVFITADMNYHNFFDAENKILIADIGHYESEFYTKELIFELLNKKFANFAIQISTVNTNPIKYF